MNTTTTLRTKTAEVTTTTIQPNATTSEERLQQQKQLTRILHRIQQELRLLVQAN